MSGLATMGDLFERHRARLAAAAPPAPAPPRPARPAAIHQRAAIERIPRGDGFELRVAGTRVASVTPTAGGFVVNNHGAGCKATMQDARQAEALAARIARLAAIPTGKGEE